MRLAYHMWFSRPAPSIVTQFKSLHRSFTRTSSSSKSQYVWPIKRLSSSWRFIRMIGCAKNGQSTNWWASARSVARVWSRLNISQPIRRISKKSFHSASVALCKKYWSENKSSTQCIRWLMHTEWCKSSASQALVRASLSALSALSSRSDAALSMVSYGSIWLPTTSWQIFCRLYSIASQMYISLNRHRISARSKTAMRIACSRSLSNWHSIFWLLLEWSTRTSSRGIWSSGFSKWTNLSASLSFQVRIICSTWVSKDYCCNHSKRDSALPASSNWRHPSLRSLVPWSSTI